MLNAIRQSIGLAMAGKSPWGGSGGGKGSGGDNGGGGDEPSGTSDSGDGPRNPWLPGGGSSDKGRRSASIEDIFKNRGPEGPRRRGGGPGGPNLRLPDAPGGKSWAPIIIIGLIALGVVGTSTHLIGPQEQAVVKTLGNYTRTLEPGLRFSAPFPIETVDVEDVQGVRVLSIPGSGEGVKLILTGDQNLVDLSYIVRWNIKDLEDFKFRLVQPVETVGEAAEAAMRAAIAEKNLDETFTGQGRAEIQSRWRSVIVRALGA